MTLSLKNASPLTSQDELWHCSSGVPRPSLADYVRGPAAIRGAIAASGASVAFALILSLDSWQIAEKSGPIPIFPRYSHVDSHWVLREVDPAGSGWDASEPNSVCPTCQTRPTSKVRLFDFGDCGLSI